MDEFVKAARFLQIEGAKDFNISMIGVNASNEKASTSITTYQVDQDPPVDLQPLSWLSAQDQTIDTLRPPLTSPADSMPNSPSSFHSSDSFESINSLKLTGKPTIVVNGATGEFTTFYQQMSPINLKLDASNAANNKQELKLRLLQKRQQSISNGGVIDCSRPKKKTFMEMRLNSSVPNYSNDNFNLSPSTELPLIDDYQATIQPGNKKNTVKPCRILNGSGELRKPNAANIEDREDDAVSGSLKVVRDELPTELDISKLNDIDVNLVDGENNKNIFTKNIAKLQDTTNQPKVKDNVVIVNQNSSKCLMLKIKAGKIYRDEHDSLKGKC